MTETLCSCCKLLGKPPARINFIIATGQPDSLVYPRIKYLLKNYSKISALENDAHLTNYEALMNISNQLFDRQNGSSSIEQATSVVTEKCCHGFTSLSTTMIDDIPDSSQLDTLQENILDILKSKDDPKTEEKDTKVEPASWIMISNSICLEPELLNVFLRLRNQNSSLLKFSLTILCFLVNEEQLFENWFLHDLPIENYQSYTYPKYENRINNFFSLLNTSEYLQQNTLLINEEDVLTDNELQILLQDIFRSGSWKYRANNVKFRHSMAKLLVRRWRTIRDVRSVRNSLQKFYNPTVKNRLTLLLNNLKQTATAAAAARQITLIVLDEFERMNEEEKRVYTRQLMLGFKDNDAEHSNTITAQLVHYALYLLKNDTLTSIPLIYSIVLAICRLSTHFIFRHQLFNNTPQIYELSLLLINQRQYTLTLSGLRLCATILNSDRIEHKSALAYWKYDASSARKILDAIKWLLSPYIALKNLWKEEAEKKSDDSESNKEESTLYTTERFCFRHAWVLVERSYIRGLASLFYGSTDHCAQVTEDDVSNFVEVIRVLIDPRMGGRYSVESKSRFSVILMSELCALLTPIFFYSSPSVHLALIQDDCLLIAVPRAIRFLLDTRNTSKDMINTCVQFYTQLIQSTCKQPESVADTKNEEKIEQSDVKTTDPSTTDLLAPLNPSPHLISSYFDLHRQIQEMFESDKKSGQQDQIQKLLEEEWAKLNTLQLQHDYEQLKNEHVSLKEELSQLRNELQRTRLDKDELRKENIRLSQEIDRLNRMPVTNVIAESQQITNIVSPGYNNEENTIDDLTNLLPHEITRTQAEQCIREICRRRTKFNDPDMRKSICGSLKHLGSDLYSSPVHFLHELIQNAEDNFYDNTVTPCLRIELDHSYILLANNEKGLRTQDVLAICSLAVTTKTIQQGQIGEKGVGFKSVFAASNQPTLISHAWRFRFHVPGLDAMSYITPQWLADQDIPDCISNEILKRPQDTYLYLPLKLQAHTSEAELFLDQVTMAADPCILLNMRHLEMLEIIDKRQNKVTLIEKQLIGSTKLKEQASVTFEYFSFIDLTGSMIKLCTSSEFNTFRVYTCYIDVPTSIEQRRSPRTRLILAFPCENNYCLTSTVYTGLPVCNLGFNFLFNADFQLVTNRENVRENVPFNTFIRDHLAALFVYLMLNDSDLRKDIHRYCPSTNIHQLKHSSWWLIMIDNINTLITKYLSVLYDIRTGKAIRHFNTDLASLVSNEQLYNCADIQVIESDTGFLTAERLKSFQIQSVSILDVLSCFPNREETVTTNEFRQQFRSWAENQDKQWWSQLFHHISQTITSNVFNLMLQKPIFLLNNDHQRKYLPTSDDRRLLLFISDDPSFQMWKRQLTLLKHASEFERTALLKSNQIQLLTEERMIKIIHDDHLQLANSSSNTNFNLKLIDEIWKDLFYLKSRVDKLDKSTPLLIPVNGTPNWTLIQEAILPTILGVDISSFMCSTTSPIIHFPYYNTYPHQLTDILEWEHFLLEMNCQRPSICLPLNYTITKLPLLPAFTKFTVEKCAQMGQSILSVQTENTKDCLRQFPITADSMDEQQICSVSTTFDESIVQNLPSLPRIIIPSHCRELAMNLGVCVGYDLRTCVTILQLLSNEKNTNVDLYIEWLGRLQLHVRQQKEFNSQSLLSSCQLYLPDQKNFYPLKDLLVIPDNEEHRNSILIVAKYLKLQWISPTINQIYWQFKELFRVLGCTCAINIDHIYNTIYQASRDKSNFFALGDCKTILKESGMETMIILFQHLEDLILKCVKEDIENQDLYRAIVQNKHSTAPCGSRDDLQWRFSFTCNSLSKQLKTLTGIQSQSKKISLPTIDRRLIRKTTENIVYGCLEMIIAQTLSKDIGKRHFILPLIARTCPLVMAVFEIDYVERRGKFEWEHKNHNMECQLIQLTNIFRDTVNDFGLEVITAKYARISLLLSDSFIINSSDEQDNDEIDRYSVDTDYPFWIFNKIVLHCVGYEKHDTTKAIIATSALTTLLHKRKYLPFEEAKSIAQQKISACTTFRSDNIANVAGAESSIYSYTDLLFPTNHHSVESMIISIGNYCTTEQDLEDEKTISEVNADRVAESRSAVDRVYRNRVKTQNHLSQNNNTTKSWSDSSIVDGIEKIRIGQEAEHFFFDYLQHLYGSVDVTPTKNWRSSSRLNTYPQYRRNVDDAAGFDFELHDTREVFTRGSGSTTKTCYFEVKGTSGLYNQEHTRFHVSQNELEVCQAIQTNEARREREAYFIVIIQNCLDPEKISFGTTIDWSTNFDMVYKTVDSYQCKIISSPPTNFHNWRRDGVTDYKNNQQQPHQSMNSNNRNNNPMAQSVPTNNNNSAPARYEPPHLRNQQQQSMNSNSQYNNSMGQSVPTSNNNSASGRYNSSSGRNQQRQGQIPPSNRRQYQ